MNYKPLSWIVGVLVVCAALAYAAFRWRRTPEVLRALGYRGPRDLLRRLSTELAWFVAVLIGLILLGALLKMLGSP
jgi:hypothetical protein